MSNETRKGKVTMLPPFIPRPRPPRPLKPPVGKDRDSLAWVLYELAVANERRKERGLPLLSYGQYVALQRLDILRPDIEPEKPKKAKKRKKGNEGAKNGANDE